MIGSGDARRPDPVGWAIVVAYLVGAVAAAIHGHFEFLAAAFFIAGLMVAFRAWFEWREPRP